MGKGPGAAWSEIALAVAATDHKSKTPPETAVFSCATKGEDFPETVAANY
jgi:hypothetical protein